MITVWGRRNSVNVQKVMWALGELKLDYRRMDVSGSFGIPDDYPALNPNRTVPTITDGELTLWESNACVRYLARSYGEGLLWPAHPAPLARADQWMDWTSNVLMPAFFQIFLNLVRLPPADADPRQADAGARRCATLLRIVDQELEGSTYIAGDEFSMGDIALGPLTYRYFNLPIEHAELPHVSAWYERLARRPAYQKHVMIPFGRNHEEWNALEKEGAGVQ